jgi:uncharacterized protein
MRKTTPAGLAALVSLAILCAAGTARAASFNCNSRNLSETEAAICQDAQLSRVDEQTVRRLSTIGRRLGFGLYLGLRYWHSGWKEQRDRCLVDRICLGASYRAQNRFLDRLQQCLDTGPQRRACLRNTLDLEHATTVRR